MKESNGVRWKKRANRVAIAGCAVCVKEFSLDVKFFFDNDGSAL